MATETPFIIAIAATLTFSLGLLWFLWQYLDPALADYCGDPVRGRVWCVLCSALLIVAPLFALTLEAPAAGSQPLAQVFAHLRWPLLAQMIAVFVVGVVVLALHVPRELPMTRSEIDDMKRLLDKVQQVRAKDILSHAEATPAVNPKELEDLNRLVDKIQATRRHDLHRRDDPHSAN